MTVLWRDPRRAGLLMTVYFLLALLLSPAVYERTRPPGLRARAVPLWRGRQPARLFAVLAAGLVLGLVGLAAAAALIGGQLRAYGSDTVRVRVGHPVRVTLPAGSYGVYGGCAENFGCAELGLPDLAVRGSLSGPVSLVPRGSLGRLTIGGQTFDEDLAFTIPAGQPVRVVLNRDPGQPVFVAPASTKRHVIRVGIVAVAGCALLFLAALTALTGLAWPRARQLE